MKLIFTVIFIILLYLTIIQLRNLKKRSLRYNQIDYYREKFLSRKRTEVYIEEIQTIYQERKTIEGMLEALENNQKGILKKKIRLAREYLTKSRVRDYETALKIIYIKDKENQCGFVLSTILMMEINKKARISKQN